MPIQQDVFKRSTAEVGDFVKGLRENSKRDGTFDSAAAQDYVSTALNQNTGVKVPQELQIVLDEAKEDLQKNQIIRAVLDSCDGYREAHGVDAPADIVEQALHNAYATTNYAKKQYSLDSADNLHHDQLSLQPNRAVVSIISTIVEACPFAHYLPADIGSNEARLAILSHQAGDKFGGYKANDLIDGINSGEPYMLSSRLHTAMPNGSGVVTGKITAVQTDADHCDQSAGDLKLLRGRAVVYIDGRIAAVETPTTTGSGNSPISGTITIGDTSYSITGNINTDTGAYTLNTSPALPQTVPVAVEGFIDFERAGELTPTIITHVDTFALYAKSARARTHLSIDSRTQMSNELGLDPLSESVVAINAQYNNERYYDALRKGMRLAKNNTETFDFSKAISHQDTSRQAAWYDIGVQLNIISQRMAEETINHGITHIYVGKRVASQLVGMPNTVFTPSGITARPSIYRLGRLFNMVDVYYTPKVVQETADSAQILCVGRATDVARNPIVMGDAVPPTMVPLAVNADLRQGVGYYSRNFLSVNPHDPSARGFGLIEVTNMG